MNLQYGELLNSINFLFLLLVVLTQEQVRFHKYTEMSIYTTYVSSELRRRNNSYIAR